MDDKGILYTHICAQEECCRKCAVGTQSFPANFSTISSKGVEGGDYAGKFIGCIFR